MLHRQLDGALSEFDVVVNTVPAPDFRGKCAEAVKAGGCLCVDVASIRGIDASAAEALGLTIVWARALPGKLMPCTAGRIIRDTVFEILKEQGVIL